MTTDDPNKAPIGQVLAGADATLAGRRLTDDAPKLAEFIDKPPAPSILAAPTTPPPAHSGVVLTRAQMRFQYEQARIAELETDIGAMENERATIQQRIDQLAAALKGVDAELRDARIEHKAAVASMNLMRTEGIHL